MLIYDDSNFFGYIDRTRKVKNRAKINNRLAVVCIGTNRAVYIDNDDEFSGFGEQLIGFNIYFHPMMVHEFCRDLYSDDTPIEGIYSSRITNLYSLNDFVYFRNHPILRARLHRLILKMGNRYLKMHRTRNPIKSFRVNDEMDEINFRQNSSIFLGIKFNDGGYNDLP